MTDPATVARGLSEALAERLYAGFWLRNGWASPTPFADQAGAIKAMWLAIAADALTGCADDQTFADVPVGVQ